MASARAQPAESSVAGRRAATGRARPMASAGAPRMTRVLGATAAARVLLLTLLLLVLAPAHAVPTERQRVVAMPVPTDVAPLAQALASAAAGVTPAQGLRWGNAAAQTLSQAPAMPPAGTDGGSEDRRGSGRYRRGAGAAGVVPHGVRVRRTTKRPWQRGAAATGRCPAKEKGDGAREQLHVPRAAPPSGLRASRLPTRAARSFRSSCKLMVLTLALADSS